MNHALFTCSIARQVWALSGVLQPKEGFDSLSLFSNFVYLFKLKLNLSISLEARRVFPCVLWRLWKNRNKLLFDGILFNSIDTTVKIREDADSWFLAPVLSHEEETKAEYLHPKEPVKWKQPDTG